MFSRFRRSGIRLTDFSPFGPIFGKELRATSRRRRNYALRVLYLAALLLALLVAWSSTSNRVYTTSVAAQAQAQAQMGQVFFASFTVFSVMAMMALGPVLTCTAVSAERLGKTLHVLLMTPITTWQILSGKLFSRLLVALTLIGLSLPALALVRLLGGVELSQMVGVVCLCVATVLATATMGLLFSTFMDRAYAAILLSYAAILFLYAFVPFILVMGFELNPAPFARLYSAINPMVCAAMLAEPRGATTWADWAPCVGVHLGASAAFVAASAWVLRRTARRAGDGRGAKAPAGAGGAGVVPAAASGAAAAAEPVPEPSSPSLQVSAAAREPTRAGAAAPARDVSDRPVLWRETRRPLMAKPWQAVVGAAASVVLMLVTYVVLYGDGLLDEDWSHVGYAWVFNLIVWLLSSVLAATAIAQEKESDTWTLLLTTPLSGSSIVWGKVLGIYRRLAWPGALVLTHFGVFTVSGVIKWPAFLLTLWVIFSFNTVWVAVGVFLSLRYRKVTFAVILNLLLAVVIYVAVFFVLLVVGELTSDHELAEFVGWYLPYYYLGEGISHHWPDLSARTTLPQNSGASGLVFLMTAWVIGVIHVALSFLILHATAVRFDRIVGRAAQGAPQRRGFDAIARPPAGAVPS